MTSSVADQIREHLWSYIRSTQSLDDFDRWFAPVLWNIEKLKDPIADELAYAVELAMAEFTSGNRDEASLKAAFVDLASVIDQRNSGAIESKTNCVVLHVVADFVAS